MSLTEPKSNYVYEEGRELVEPTYDRELLQVRDPEVYLNRLNEITTPGGRVLELLKSTFSIYDADATHQSKWIRSCLMESFIGGLVLGGIFNSGGLHEKYVRTHNAEVFQGKHRRSRMWWDFYFMGILEKGLKYGAVAAAVTFTGNFIVFGSLVYRGRLCMSDWVLGFGAMGALSRIQLGTRGLISGGVLGASAGLFVYGIARGIELATSVTMQQRMYENHRTWLVSRERELRRNQLMGQQQLPEIINQVSGR